MSEHSLPSLKEVINAHGLRAKRSLGQNFLLDPSILSHIVKAAGSLEGRTVIEVGPGPGGLTRHILDNPIDHLHVIEMDSRCIEIMEQLQEHYPKKLSIIAGDALKIDCSQLGRSPRRIISNLPYNVSVPLLFQWLDHIDQFESLTLLFQKEVAKRITAQPRTSDYGKLSIMTQWCCDVSMVFDIPPGAFLPAPKVISTLVNFRPKAHPPEVDSKALQTLTQAGFNQRRKMLRASLKSVVSDPVCLLQNAGIDPTRRAEELSVEEFCHLANALSAL